MDRIVTPSISVPDDTLSSFKRAMKFEKGQVVQVISTMETTNGPVHTSSMNEWVGRYAVIQEVRTHECILKNEHGGMYSFCYFSFLPVSHSAAERFTYTFEEAYKEKEEESDMPAEEERQNYMNEVDSELIDMDVCTNGRYLVANGLTRLFELEKRVSKLEEV